MPDSSSSPRDRLAYRIQEAADAIGISRSQLYIEIGQGRIPTVTIGRRRLVRREDLDAYLDGLAREQSDGPHAA